MKAVVFRGLGIGSKSRLRLRPQRIAIGLQAHRVAVLRLLADQVVPITDNSEEQDQHLENRPETPGRRSRGVYSGSTKCWYRSIAMLGERSNQRGLWEADQLYLDLVGRGAHREPRYVGSSVKGAASIDWSDRRARRNRRRPPGSPLTGQIPAPPVAADGGTSDCPAGAAGAAASALRGPPAHCLSALYDCHLTPPPREGCDSRRLHDSSPL